MQESVKQKGIEIIKGRGYLKDRNHVTVIKEDGGELEIETDYIIIATGSVPERLNISGKNLDGVITCEEVLDFNRRINEIVIIGGGFIGIEMAGILSAFGVVVKVVELKEDILYNIDDDIREKLYGCLEQNGIKIYTSCSVKDIVKDRGKLCVKVMSKGTTLNLQCDTVMMSAGRTPVTDGLNLDSIGVLYDSHGIKVDASLRTNIDNIFAVGDVTGTMMLAHVASNQGKKVIKTIKGHNEFMDFEKVPYCIYTFPEVAGVGLTEKAAKDRGIAYSVGYSNFMESSRAQAMGNAYGFVKIICGEDKKIIGVHIMGPHASDVIHEGALAVSKGLHVEDIINCIHGHPTLSECLYDAACNIKKSMI